MKRGLVGVIGEEYIIPTLNGKKKRNKQEKKTRLTKFEQFCLDFAAEIDIFSSQTAFPDWVFDYRDDLLRKISPELRKICYSLKQRGLVFKVKWPVEIDGKWKFADVFFPGQKTVLILANPMGNFRPCGLPSYRAEFFRDRYRVIEVETLEELQRKMEEKRHLYQQK